MVRDNAFRADELSSSQSVLVQLTISGCAHFARLLITIPPIDNLGSTNQRGRNKQISRCVCRRKRDAKKHVKSYHTEQSHCWPSQLLWISLTLPHSARERITFIQLCVPSFLNCVFLIGAVYFITSHFINHHSISLPPLTISLWL